MLRQSDVERQGIADVNQKLKKFSIFVASIRPDYSSNVLFLKSVFDRINTRADYLYKQNSERYQGKFEVVSQLLDTEMFYYSYKERQTVKQVNLKLREFTYFVSTVIYDQTERNAFLKKTFAKINHVSYKMYKFTHGCYMSRSEIVLRLLNKEMNYYFCSKRSLPNKNKAIKLSY